MDHDKEQTSSKGIDSQTATALFTAMEELKAVIDGENEVLALGLPNTILELKARKAALQAQCTLLLLDVSEDVEALAMDQAVLDQLAAVTADMRRLTGENAKLLSEASKATRRRIDAVMNAIQVTTADATLADVLAKSSKGDVKG